MYTHTQTQRTREREREKKEILMYETAIVRAQTEININIYIR